MPNVASKLGEDRPTGDSTDKHLAKANNLLAELDREEKSGFNLGEKSRDDDFDMGASDKKKGESKKSGGLGAMNLNGGLSKDDPSDGNYDDDFDDDIEEDLPVDQVDPMEDADLNARSGNQIAGSGQGITVS